MEIEDALQCLGKTAVATEVLCEIQENVMKGITGKQCGKIRATEFLMLMNEGMLGYCMDNYHVRLIAPAQMTDDEIMKFQSSLREVIPKGAHCAFHQVFKGQGEFKQGAENQ